MLKQTKKKFHNGMIMKMPGRIFSTFLLAFMVVGLTAFKTAADCDESVQRLHTRHLGGITLCELQSRYKIALDRLNKMGVQNPKHIGNFFAPRFIKQRVWEAYLSRNGDSEFAAWNTYRPAPVTWQNWSTAAANVQNPLTKRMILEGTVDDIKSWLIHLHTIEMTGLLPLERIGAFRTNVAEIIPLHSISDAYKKVDIESISQTPFVSARTGQRLMNWSPRACEDMPASVYQRSGFYFQIDSAAPTKSCGDLTMAPEDEVLEQMDLWAAYLQNGLRALVNHSQQIDLIAFASRVQQWFVVVHPFVDGNGRTSRFMMDLIFDQFGLPSVILDDMDRDFFATADEWADEVGQGMLKSVRALEACVQNPSALGCTVVSDAPPTH